ncbi:hypothetical protein [Streptomyces sp. HB132]|uniref:hypothetical protein n=1 Tax=Streptomyces sp. HB132 TaxID=767388 RepID=UPI001D5506E2|nr:hypothetical protein [Streptomyces sp. HB132]MBM7437196.1 hypothetical protein [Streptomyces sp. HB132]
MTALLGRDGVTVEDLFLPPEDAAARAVHWAAETGQDVREGPLLELLRIERPERSAEELFFAFLDRLGVESLPAEPCRDLSYRESDAFQPSGAVCGKR